MIFNFLKHFLLALLLDAGAALAFGVDEPATTDPLAPQSCLLPAATFTDAQSTHSLDTGARS
jgi:hypothetical protein